MTGTVARACGTVSFDMICRYPGRGIGRLTGRFGSQYLIEGDFASLKAQGVKEVSLEEIQRMEHKELHPSEAGQMSLF